MSLITASALSAFFSFSLARIYVLPASKSTPVNMIARFIPTPALRKKE
jgi:hypothetical protein